MSIIILLNSVDFIGANFTIISTHRHWLECTISKPVWTIAESASAEGGIVVKIYLKRIKNRRHFFVVFFIYKPNVSHQAIAEVR